jgi:hypothetical protein
LTLSEAEQILGRPINPVTYAKETFLEKLNRRDPFLTQVLNGEKIILGGLDDELSSSFAIPKNGPRAARLVKFTPAD